MPVHYVKLPAFIYSESDKKNNERINNTVQNPGTDACLLHDAKIIAAGYDDAFMLHA